MTSIKHGNCEIEAENTRGWLIGHFIDKNSPFKVEEFELKWSKHIKGDSKSGGAALNNKAKSLAILISGSFKYYFPEEDETTILKNEGDYVFWSSKVSHDWEALEDSIIITVRWPSIVNDQVQ